MHETYVNGNLTITFDSALSDLAYEKFLAVLAKLETEANAPENSLTKAMFEHEQPKEFHVKFAPDEGHGTESGWHAPTNTLFLNPEDTQFNGYFSLEDGSIQPASLERIIVHELVHATLGLKDLVDEHGELFPKRPDFGPRVNEMLADPTSDFMGETVRLTNKIMEKLYQEPHRGHYVNFATLGESVGIVVTGADYDQVIFGPQFSTHHIEINRLGSVNEDGADEKAIIIGGAGNETINAGDGDDFVHAGKGNDFIEGGEGRDHLIGGDGQDTLFANYLLEGDDGASDYLQGGAGQDIYHIGHSWDIARAVQTGDGQSGGTIRPELAEVVDVISDSDGSGIIKYDSGYSGIGKIDTDGLYGLLKFGTGDNWFADQANGMDPVWVLGGGNTGNHIYLVGLRDSIYATPHSWTNAVTNESQSGLLLFERESTNKYRAVVLLEGFSNGDFGMHLDMYGGGGGGYGGGNGAGGSNDPSITLSGTYQPEAVQGTAGDDVMFASAGDDTVEGGDGNDILVGGYGEDELNGGSGDDTYHYATGDGADVIYDSSGASDKLKLEGISPAGVIVYGGYSGRDNTDFAIKLADGTVLYVKDHYDAGGANSIESIEFDDGTTWSLSDINARALDPVANFAPMLGVTQGTTGDDNFSSNAAYLGTAFDGGAGNDKVWGKTNVDDTIYGGAGDDEIVAAGGSDKIYGETGNDRLAVTAGNHTVDGGDGVDTLKLGAMLGRDGWIVDLETGVATNGTSQSQFSNMENVEASHNGTGDTLSGNSDANIILGSKGDDTIEGRGGNDTLQGGIDNDQYVYSLGDGQDEILDESGTTDKVVLHNIVTGSVALYYGIADPNDLIISFNDGGSITVKGHFDITATKTIEQIVFDDATIWLEADINALVQTQTGQTINGTASADVLDGTSLDDEINGLAGDDTLNGNGGDDKLNGGAGADALDGGAGTDTASYAGASAGVTVHMGDLAQNTGDALGDTFTSIENLEGSDHNDTIIMVAGDNFVWGGAGNDAINGGDGHDTLYGDAGDDQLYGDAGNDTLDGGDGDDVVFGYEDNDLIILGNGNDYAIGGSGDDSITGGAGNDEMHGHGGAGRVDRRRR